MQAFKIKYPECENEFSAFWNKHRITESTENLILQFTNSRVQITDDRKCTRQAQLLVNLQEPTSPKRKNNLNDK